LLTHSAVPILKEALNVKWKNLYNN
jgi:hypothetical protein